MHLMYYGMMYYAALRAIIRQPRTFIITKIFNTKLHDITLNVCRVTRKVFLVTS